MCIFNKLQDAGLFLALDGTSTRTDPSTSGRKYRKSVNNTVFIRDESLFVVSAVSTNAFQLKHMLRLLHSICPAGNRIRTIKYESRRSMGNTIGAYTRYITYSTCAPYKKCSKILIWVLIRSCTCNHFNDLVHKNLTRNHTSYKILIRSQQLFPQDLTAISI